MKRGYLISFEGQDASGKSELLYRVDDTLRRKGHKTAVVEEFSISPMGDYLRELLTSDKFLIFGKKLPTAFSGTMYVITDLYYQDEQEIKPRLNEGKVVLKERHIDTLFACQIPKVKDDYPQLDYESLYRWIENTTSNLYIPDLTFLLTVPEDVLISRIRGRGESISDEDLRIFAERERIYKQLADRHKDRIVVFDNNRDIEEAAEEIADKIISLTK